ncbi:dipeptidase [Solimonas sp. SE-A11]|uniref:dipeptidase n=1 Tax=Solimonas sp. SE-A11 TaxID=3054954 RepID=UPI00259CC172|nr:membrane dipeptidase [Solimonas sp. SE-A11]MDM4769945.1 membrane dipeptidase [Solimonas sp. SE-A11]
MDRPRTQPLTDRRLVWDNHACMPLRPDDKDFLPQLERHRAAGATVVILNVSCDCDAIQRPFEMLASVRDWLSEWPQHYIVGAGVGDIERAHREGKLAVFFDMEGGIPVQDEPSLVPRLYALGVRWMLLAYNQNNKLAGGCQDEDIGLTAQGRRVIDAMKDCGMVLCCTHTGARTAREAIDYIQQPVIFSHSNPRAVHDHPRNITDDLILACAASGGVININGVGLFLGDNDNSTETYLRHVRYVADLVGPQHVGIGLDYVFDRQELDDFVTGNPQIFPPALGYGAGIRMVEPERIPVIADALLASGWSDADLQGFLGTNNLRVARAVWK